jgi:hypothetical protein
MSHVIELSIQLPHFDTFGVKFVSVNFVKSVILQCSQRMLKNVVIARFSSPSWPHQHQSVTNLNCVIELNNLLLNSFTLSLNIFTFCKFISLQDRVNYPRSLP